MKKILVSLGVLVAFVLIHPVHAQAANTIEVTGSGSEHTGVADILIAVSPGVLSSAVPVQITFAGGTATIGTDYTIPNPDPGYTNKITFTVPAGTYVPFYSPGGSASFFHIQIPIVNDTANEGEETIGLNMSTLTSGISINSTSNIIIEDDEPRITELSLFNDGFPPYILNEGGVAPKMHMQVCGVFPTSTVQVNYSGSATNGSDFIGPTTITIPAGYYGYTGGECPYINTSIPIIDDTIVESNETIIATLNNLSSGVIYNGTTSSNPFTITDNDIKVGFMSGSYSTNESSGQVVLKVKVAGGQLYSPATVDMNALGGTATAGVDYKIANSILWPANHMSFTIPAGNYTTPSTIDIPVTIYGDTQIEPNETAELYLSNPLGVGLLGIGASHTTLTIINSTTKIKFHQPSAPSVTENVGSTNLAFDVVGGVLINPATVALSHQYTGSNSATYNVDYAFPVDPIIITVPAGNYTSGSNIIVPNIQIVNDSIHESPESIRFNLDTPTGNLILDADNNNQHRFLTITDDDPAVQFSAPTYTVNENAGTLNLHLDVSDGKVLEPATVQVKVTGGSATPTADFTWSNVVTVTIPPGNYLTSSGLVNVPIPIIDDTLYEPSETINFSLANPIGISLGNQSTNISTIKDNDQINQVETVHTQSGGGTNKTKSNTTTTQTTTDTKVESTNTQVAPVDSRLGASAITALTGLTTQQPPVATPAPAPPATDPILYKRPLAYGSTGEDVTQLQNFLISKGYSTQSTGFYGRQTVQAIKAYQRDHNLDPVGIVGPKTLTLLNWVSQ